MKRSACITLGILLSALAASDSAAQWNVARFDTDRNRLYATFGLDPALITSLGYGRVFRVYGHVLQFSGEAGVVTAHTDLRDFRVRLGAETSLLHWRSVHLMGSAVGIARGTDNVIYRGYDFGADITGKIGVYRPRWFAAAEFGKDKAVITHVTHSDWYRTHYFPDAKDGWYLDAGGTLHHGFSAGLTLGRTEVLARFGWLRTEDWRDLTPPMYGSVGLGFGF